MDLIYIGMEDLMKNLTAAALMLANSGGNRWHPVGSYFSPLCDVSLWLGDGLCRVFSNHLHFHGMADVIIKEGLYRSWCGVNRLGDSGLHSLGDTSAFVNPVGQLLLALRGKTRMDGVGIVFEFYIAPL